MRWPIRNQILLPFGLLQAAVIAALSFSFAWQATRRAEQETIDRLNRVAATLATARFPMQPSVLEQMQGLSGADFVVRDLRGRVRSTLDANTARQLLESFPDTRDDDRQLTTLWPVNAAGQRWLGGRVPVFQSPELRDLFVVIPEAEWRTQRREAILPPLITGLTALLATAALSWVIAGRFSGRLRRMQQQVRQLAAGRIELLLPEAGNDELRDLSASINRMAADLQTLAEQIRRGERESLVAQVAGGLAHQLRNAITGARMAVQLHQRRHPGEASPTLDVALRELELMEHQIRGLLGVTRDVQRPAVPGSIREIVQNVVELLRPQCEHAGVHLILRTGGAVPAGVVPDRELIHAAVLNVVRNAIEASGNGGQVRVDLSVSGEETSLTVLDNGPGVPENLAGRIFEPFVTGRPEGVGLGLALARQAAEATGGELTWQRNDGWTRFRFHWHNLPPAG